LARPGFAGLGVYISELTALLRSIYSIRHVWDVSFDTTQKLGLILSFVVPYDTFCAVWHNFHQYLSECVNTPVLRSVYTNSDFCVPQCCATKLEPILSVCRAAPRDIERQELIVRVNRPSKFLDWSRVGESTGGSDLGLGTELHMYIWSQFSAIFAYFLRKN
jgi:hypothetical protein